MKQKLITSDVVVVVVVDVCLSVCLRDQTSCERF